MRSIRWRCVCLQRLSGSKSSSEPGIRLAPRSRRCLLLMGDELMSWLGVPRLPTSDTAKELRRAERYRQGRRGCNAANETSPISELSELHIHHVSALACVSGDAFMFWDVLCVWLDSLNRYL